MAKQCRQTQARNCPFDQPTSTFGATKRLALSMPRCVSCSSLPGTRRASRRSSGHSRITACGTLPVNRGFLPLARTRKGLPPEAVADREAHAAGFKRRLIELGPAYVKLGQVLSTRPDILPPAYIVHSA